jgi:ABC-type phosphate/phosphonate transport system substrate-binding protein
MFANARMYAVNEPTAAAWRALLEWVIARAEVPCEIIEYPPPQPLSALWAREDLGCAFMCGYPLARTAPTPVVLAAPVPSPATYGGAAVYWTDFIVRADSPMWALTDIFGRRFAFTDEASQSGYQAPRAFLASYAKVRGSPLFAATVGPLITPRRVIEAVLDGRVDAGPLDSYVHDLIRAHEPEVAARLRTIASTIPTPIPPLVAAPNIAPADAMRLRQALLAVGQALELAPVRAALLLKEFVSMPVERYDDLLAQSRVADALDYPRLA